MNTQVEASVEEMGAEDLQRLVEIVRTITAARDAMSDEIVTRVARAVSEGLNLLDRLTRNEGVIKLLQVLDRQETQYLLIAWSEAIRAAGQEIPMTAPAVGGLGCTLRVMRDPGVLEALRLVAVLGKHLSENLREQHRHGG